LILVDHKASHFSCSLGNPPIPHKTRKQQKTTTMKFCKCDGLKAWILVCTLVLSAAVAVIIPFLPIEIENKGISSVWVGPIFAIYPVGIIVASPLVSRLVPCLGAANVIALGMAGIGISLACLGIIMYSNNVQFIIGAALLSQFIQGVASAFIRTTCYIITTNEYTNDQEHIVGLMEGMLGIGLLVGPLIGSALYAATDFETSFLVFGAVTLATAVGIKYAFPKTTCDSSRESKPKGDCHGEPTQSIYLEDDDQSTESTHPLEADPKKLPDFEFGTCGVSAASTCTASSTDFSTTSDNNVSFWKLARLARCSLALWGSALCIFMYSFLEPILSERLLDFDLSVPQIGLFFALFPIFYIPTSVCVQWIPDWIEKRVTIAFSLLVSSFALLLVGPSRIIPFPDSLIMMGIGWCILGISLATFLIPILPEMVESSLAHFPGQEKQVNSMCSGLFNSFMGIGQFISPLYGSIVSDRIGFRLTTDFAAVIGFIFFIIYFVLADVRQALRMNSERVDATTSQHDVDDDMDDDPTVYV
jgi:MFS family permease